MKKLLLTSILLAIIVLLIVFVPLAEAAINPTIYDRELKFDSVILLSNYQQGELIITTTDTTRGDSVKSDYVAMRTADKVATHYVWLKDLELWTENGGYKSVSFYYDSRLIPKGLTDKELLIYWDEMRYVAREQFAVTIDGQKDYGLMAETYVGSPQGTENYWISGRYNSNPGGIERD